MFIFGAILGSFLNTLSLQRTHRESLFRVHSQCPNCHTTLRWYELIPLFSYGLQRGKCRHCQAKISLRYFYSELLLALVGWSMCFLPLSNNHVILLHLILSTLFYIAIRDWDSFIIDDVSLIFLVVLGLLWNQAFPLPLIEFVQSLIFCIGLAILAHKTQAIGSGDIYLLSVVGLFLGYHGLLFAFLVGNSLAFIHRLYEIYTQQKKRNDLIAYASYLSIGISISLIYFRVRI